MYSIGFNDEELKDIINCNNDIGLYDADEIKASIEMLRAIKCNDVEIKSIIYANPFYLNRALDDIQKLIFKLNFLGITNLNEVFYNNPFILDKDDYEIDDYIVLQHTLGKDVDDILDELSEGIME